MLDLVQMRVFVRRTHASQSGEPVEHHWVNALYQSRMSVELKETEVVYAPLSVL
jgi:hypothetical protein